MRFLSAWETVPKDVSWDLKNIRIRIDGYCWLLTGWTCPLQTIVVVYFAWNVWRCWGFLGWPRFRMHWNPCWTVAVLLTECCWKWAPVMWDHVSTMGVELFFPCFGSAHLSGVWRLCGWLPLVKLYGRIVLSLPSLPTAYSLSLSFPTLRKVCWTWW